MCAPHHEGWDQVHQIPKGILDVDLYERIIDGLVSDDCRFDHIIFQWLGDPSLHPDLPRLLNIAADKMGDRVGYLRVDTNAIRLPPARMDGILAAARPDVPLLVVFMCACVRKREVRRSARERKCKHVRGCERVRVCERARV